jgi:mannose-6-phosphate isomerase-like protein (cupin superfamily)
MYARASKDGDKFRCAGNDFVMLLPRDITDCCEVVLEKVATGRRTPPNSHQTFNQVYIILSGEAHVTMGEETRHLCALSVAYVPKNTNHYVVNTGATELQYLYVTIWPSGIPAEETNGGWKTIYSKMIQEYVDRGYAIE